MLPISWYSIVCEPHRFFIAVARTVVKNDGKGALLQTSLFGLVELCLKKLGSTLLSGSSPGFLALLHVGQEDGKAGRIIVSPDDVAGWPHSVSLLVKFSAFLEVLHWPSSVDDLGRGGATFL